jgi:hypothetical protein
MSPSPTDRGDERPSWALAAVGALHPVRWAVCLVGLLATQLGIAAALAAAGLGPVEWMPWPRDLPAELARLGEYWFGNHPGTAVFRCLPLVLVLSAVWGPIAGWIARSELLHHRRLTGDRPADPAQPTPVRFIAARISGLCGPPLLIWFLIVSLVLLDLIPVLLIRVPVIGAPLVAVALLPAILAVNLGIALIAVGSISVVIMPAAVAADGDDNFAALSRGYSYLYQRPLVFALWSGLSLAVACLPCAALQALSQRAPDLVGARPWPPLELAAESLGLSLFWTLQSLAYLKLRRLIDETPETELWDGVVTPSAPGKEPNPGAAIARRLTSPLGTETPPTRNVPKPDGASESSTEPPLQQETPEPVLPARPSLTLGDTVHRGALRTFSLFPHVLATALVLAGGALVVSRLAGNPGGGTLLEDVRLAVLMLNDQNPGALLGILAVALVLGAITMSRPAKAAARVAAISAVYGRAPAQASREFVRTGGSGGLGSTLALAAGVEVYLATLLLVPLVVEQKCGWQEAAWLGALAVLFLGAGAFGLGAVVAGQRCSTRPPPGGVSVVFGDPAGVLVSAAAKLVSGAVTFVMVLGFAWLMWRVTYTILSAGSGGRAGWVRWGLGPTVQPDPADAGVASWAAGFWFAVSVGIALTYPVAAALRWGAVAYLWARQRGDGLPPGTLDLSAAEREEMRKPLRPR